VTAPAYVIYGDTYGDATDRDLIDRCVDGDTRAFDAFAHRHERMIHRFCARLTSSSEDAHDLRQDVLLKIWRGLGGFDGRSSVSTWIYRIAANAAVDSYRVCRPQPMDVGGSGRRHVALTSLAADALAVTSHENSVTQAHIVREALAQLPAPYRITVVLADCLQCSYGEIAEICDVRVGTVKSRLARGRAAMRDLLAVVERHGTGGRAAPIF
jgi:RNA polymerase sigma-70 factor, ECF subfamily